MSFDTILTETLGYEGGYTQADGHNTNYGVRQDLYDVYRKENKLESKDVKDLNYADVRKYYKSEYYDRYKLDKLPEKTSKMVFDFGVNAGTGTAIKKLQEIVGTKADGIIGKKTIEAVNKYIEKEGEDFLSHQILNKRGAHYIDLVDSDPAKNEKFLQGWMNRIGNIKRNNGLSPTE